MLWHAPAQSLQGSLARRAFSRNVWQTPSPAYSHTLTTVESKYLALVQSGLVLEDPQQRIVAGKLGQLVEQLHNHRRAVAESNQAHQAYLHKFEARVAELRAQEAARLQQEQQQAVSNQQQSSKSSLPGASFLSSLFNRQATTTTTTPPTPQLTPAQRAKLAERSIRERAAAELGPPPAAPVAPKGIYLHGSVGSGKTMLMDLFYRAAVEAGAVAVHRRMHFNAFQQEMHQRLHVLERQRQVEEEAAGANRGPHHQSHHDLSSTTSSAGSQRHVEEEDEDSDLQDQESEEEQKSSSSTSDSTQSSTSSILSTSSSPVLQILESMRRQRRAVLAIRKHILAARRKSPDALASANANNVRLAAQAVMFGAAGSGAQQGSQGSIGGRQQEPYTAALLCFDELQCTDPFSIVTLKAACEGLAGTGGVMVLTGNRALKDLPRHGLHEDMFNHWVKALRDSCEEVHLSGAHDYRSVLLEQGRVASTPSYLTPLGSTTDQQLEELWTRITRGKPSSPAAVQVGYGRSVQVPRAVGRIAWADFMALCKYQIGPPDAIALARDFDVVFIKGVPQMSRQTRDIARRFITLIDELYNNKVLVFMSAAVPPDQLFAGAGGDEPILDLEGLQFETAVEGGRLRRDVGAEGGVAPVASTDRARAEAQQLLGGQEEQFAFARAVSRLLEMQSERYASIARGAPILRA